VCVENLAHRFERAALGAQAVVCAMSACTSAAVTGAVEPSALSRSRKRQLP
jgi:hypothetical protein